MCEIENARRLRQSFASVLWQEEEGQGLVEGALLVAVTALYQLRALRTRNRSNFQGTGTTRDLSSSAVPAAALSPGSPFRCHLRPADGSDAL
jgi:hypothetical protein